MSLVRHNELASTDETCCSAVIHRENVLYLIAWLRCMVVIFRYFKLRVTKAHEVVRKTLNVSSPHECEN